MDACQNHNDCVVVYEGKSCPFCDYEQSAKGEIKDLEMTVNTAENMYDDLETEYSEALALLDDLTERCPEEVVVSRLKNDTQTGTL